MESANGGTPNHFTRLVDELRAEIASERAARSSAEQLVADSRMRERRLTKALEALEGPAPAKSGPKPPKQRSEYNRWSVSEARIAEALAVLRAASEPMTIPQIAMAMGAGSRETANKAVYALRERDQARLVGKVKVNGRMQVNTYALMPGAGNGA